MDTVTSKMQVDSVKDSGGELIVMPHANPNLVRYAKEKGLACVTGSATPTEAFTVLEAGADAVKLFNDFNSSSLAGRVYDREIALFIGFSPTR